MIVRLVGSIHSLHFFVLPARCGNVDLYRANNVEEEEVTTTTNIVAKLLREEDRLIINVIPEVPLGGKAIIDLYQEAGSICQGRSIRRLLAVRLLTYC